MTASWKESLDREKLLALVFEYVRISRSAAGGQPTVAPGSVVEHSIGKQLTRIVRSFMWHLLWMLWICVIVLVGILPLSNFVGHSHWEYIRWIPTTSNLRSSRFLFDFGANLLLFVPFGLCYVRQGSSAGMAVSLRVTGFAFLLSCAIELFQVYSHNRHPSPTDTVGNVMGAAIGVALGRHVIQR